jgi:hypothetical protein
MVRPTLKFSNFEFRISNFEKVATNLISEECQFGLILCFLYFMLLNMLFFFEGRISSFQFFVFSKLCKAGFILINFAYLHLTKADFAGCNDFHFSNNWMPWIAVPLV